MPSPTTDADRAALRATVRSFVSAGEPDWQRMAKELGLQGLGVPESVGGSGFGPQELAVVHEELGRALAGGPFFATVALAATALVEVGDATFLPSIAAGDALATLALDADVTATGNSADGGDGWRLTGRCDHVLDAADADLVLVPAGTALFVVGAEDVRCGHLAVLDGTRPQATVHLRKAPARLIAADAAAALAHTRHLAAVALAAEQVGVAQACLDMAVDYAKNRYQFGRVIGSFQAVKHLLVDLAIELELARSAMEEATLAATEQSERLPLLAAIAQATCSEAAVHLSEENIQIHGGIGVTWEHPAHLYFRRATWAECFLGPPAAHRGAIAGLLTTRS